MTDYNKLKDIFTMAEVLTFEGEDSLEVEAFSVTSGDSVTVIFSFNEDAELLGVNADGI